MKTMEIKMVKLGDIRPYFNNPRDNTRAVEPTMQSIEKYTFTKPIIVDKDGVIIAGHTRYIAAFRLGLTEVPVIYSDLNEEQAKAFRIADNKLAEKSYFDDTKLVAELKALDVPTELQAFFFEDLNQMLNLNFNYQSVVGQQEENFEEVDKSYDFLNQQEGQREEQTETEAPAPAEKERTQLYTQMQDEKGTYMYILCPYCNNIEKVYL